MEIAEKVKILVVEDERTMRTVLCLLLRQLGDFELVEAADGLDAWKLLEQGLKPDLCLIDVLLPSLDVLALVQKIRIHSTTRHLKIIICSKANDRARLTDAASLEVAGYVIKPFSAKHLQSVVSRVLGLKQGIHDTAQPDGGELTTVPVEHPEP